MSILLDVNGQEFDYPEVGDVAWGPDSTDWAVAVTSGMLQKAGGLFLLLAAVDFGASFGLKSIYYTSRTANSAAAGAVRLARTDSVSWRNAANGADLSLTVNGSDELTFNGTVLQLGTITVSDTATIDLTIAADNISGSIVAASIGDSYIAAAAAIAVNKLAALTASRAVVSDGSGFLASATTTATELGYVNGVTSAIQTQINTKQATISVSDTATIDLTLTGAGISGVIVAASIDNSFIATAAAIARSKIASGTNSHVIINDGSGVLSSEAQLAGTRGGTGVSSTATYPASGVVATQAATETLTNKTLTSPVLTTPVVDDGADFIEEASLASPSAGRRRLGVKTDGKLYLRDSAGTENQIGSAGGGGGGGIDWRGDGADAPEEGTSFGQKVFKFTDGLSQNLYGIVAVPASYVAGDPIKVRIKAFHQAASATQLLTAVATRIPQGTAIDDVTNQRTTTNTAQTGASKVIKEHVLDVTASNGQVNGVAVAAGDLLVIRLFRGTDTSTADLEFLPSSTGVSFT